jgi:hypothetical protein
MPRFRQLVAILQHWWLRLIPRPGHVEYEVKKVALKEVLLQVLQFLPVNVTLPVLNTLSVI